MELLIDRKYKKEKYTIGKLYVNGVYFCDTLEDTDRGLVKTMTALQIGKIKVYGETAIPRGRYKVKWTFSNKFKRYLPEICDVPGFSGIRMHSGNTAQDSLGCPLLGKNKVVGGLTDSRVTCERFYNIIKDAVKKEEILVTIE